MPMILYYNTILFQQELLNLGIKTVEHLSLTLLLFSIWTKGIKYPLISKTINISTYQMDTSDLLPFDETELSLPTLNIIGLLLTQNIDLKVHISFIIRSAFMRLGVL